MDNNYFYGVDYRKLKLYCKIKDIKSYYEIQKNINKKFEWDKSYEVLIDYREDEVLEIEVLTQNEKLERLQLNYIYVDFFYFFENMEEQEKIYINDILRKGTQ